MDYVFRPSVKVVEVASYIARNDDDVHGRLFFIARTYTLKKEWFVSPRDILLT